MSLDAIRNVLTLSQTEGATRLVLVVIAYHADRFTGESYASRRLLAAEANVSRSSVHLALEELLSIGEVELVVPGKGRRANTYRVLCSDSTIDPQERPVATRPSGHNEPVDNSVVARSENRSGSIVPSVVARSPDTPIRKGTEEQERFEPASDAAPAPTDLPATAVGRRSAGKHGVPPAAAAALDELKNGWRAQTVEARQAEAERLNRLLGPAQTEGVPLGDSAAPEPEPGGGRGGYGGYVPAWAAGQWEADHSDTDPEEAP